MSAIACLDTDNRVDSNVSSGPLGRKSLIVAEKATPSVNKRDGMNLSHFLIKRSSSARLAKQQPAVNVEEVDATPPAVISPRDAEASQQLQHRSNVLLPQQQQLPRSNRPALKLIDSDLENRDVDAMKFLCGDSVPAARLESVKRGLQLFEELERDVGTTSALRTDDYLQLIGECLLAADRMDLLKHLGHTSKSLREVMAVRGPRIPRFRLMLHRIVQELTKAEVTDVKYLLRDYDLSRKKLDEASDAYDVFNVLLQPGLIGETDVGMLIELLQAIKRSDLVDIAQEYQDSVGPAKTVVCTDPRLAGTAFPGTDAFQPAVTRGSGERYVQPQKPSTTGTTAETPAHSEAAILAALAERMRQEEADFPSYSMQGMPHGVCVIINNVHFRHVPEDPESKPGIRERQGSDHDAAQLSRAFTDLGFTVRLYQDLDSAMLLRCMRLIAEMDHSQSDSFVCCLLTHGLEGHVYGCDSRLVPIKDLTVPFVARQCRTLSGKPKLFFIQACQGKMKQLGAPAALETDDDSQIQPELSLIPDEADFLVGYATVPGYVSFRSPKLGSWYIRKLCEMLTRYSDRYDLLTMLTKVNDEVSKGDANVQGDQGPPLSRYKQMPAPMSTLRKRLFFRTHEQRLAAAQTRATLVSGSNSCSSSDSNSSRSGKPG